MLDQTTFVKRIGTKYLYFRRKWRSFLKRNITRSESIEPNVIFARNRLNKTGYFLPYSSLSSVDDRQINILAKGSQEHLMIKYTTEAVDILNTDTVIDCGAFVGGFSIAAFRSNVRKVISIEPSTTNFKCLMLNLCLYDVDNVEPINAALGERPGTAQLNLAVSGCDNSILSPDAGALGLSETVSVRTIRDIVEEHEIDPDHLYLKVEAEGFEPEVLMGLRDVRPRIIVVDVTPERDSESPRGEVERILRDYNYTSFKHTDRCLFAIKQP